MDWSEKAITWLLSVIGGLLAMILGFGRYWVHKNDKRHESHSSKLHRLSERLTDFEANSVTRDTVIRIQDDWRDEIHRLRQENNQRLDKIEGSITGVYQILLKRGGE